MTERSLKTNSVVLKPERDMHVRNKHPWVFMGAIESYPEFEDGDILPVVTSRGDFIGYGYFNRGQSISGRMFSFAPGDPEQIIVENIQNAVGLRGSSIGADTTAYRLINGEGDDLPGLVVDRYKDVLVMQVNTLGIEKLKPLILKTLKEILGDMPIYEKSNSPTRRKEGLPDFENWIVGDVNDNPFVVEEHGLEFEVALSGAQKTGLFLDQREMRQLARNYAKDKTVLNCFSYTGGFSVYALAGGAKQADSIDISGPAIEGARKNLALNGFDIEKNGFYTQDVLEFLSVRATPGQYDFIILDPPAFAKRANDVPNAARGYAEINQAAMEKLPKGGLLLTSSCSAHIGRDLFQTIVFNAAKYAKRKVRILSYHVLAADHPVNLFYPEGDYLKSLLLYIE